MFSLNDFLNYADAGTVPAKKSNATRTKRTANTVLPTQERTAPTAKATAVSSVIPRSFVPVPIPFAPEKTPKKGSNPVPQTIELVRYSDKAFAIFGNTKSRQAELETLGGKFNPWLKREGIATPGYIFSLKRLDTVRKALSL